ncbi:MAG: short chain dehydrogenase [Sphingobacteriales bacterium]|jgi:NAD(P)-dependent dehydrogenase (short-subunit alcohol dehydrogenase family)|nr:short chain dehydrogenase [Chitinophagaceae bacterium]MBN8864923.1 short chain dehydrogenase [Sphingobacteriales bacterium]NCT74153.1 short chain dehydrogenase [Chitinophagaceae bacterium]OJW34156.1 MAG: short chain dehydrogenase [Sphingobacteriales bacterium 46-32]
MKIILVGASGTLGRQVASALEKDHELIRVGSKSGDIQADITSPESIENLFKQTGSFDALVSTAGDAYFGPWKTMTDKEFRIGIDSKLMGQVNLVLIGQHFINPKGSFTLTAGVLSKDPVLSGSNASAANGAIEAFVRAAAIELENGVRINAVSPTVVENSPAYFPYFPGHIPATMKEVEYGYLKSILGAGTGQVITVY